MKESTVADIARRLGGSLDGDGRVVIRGVAGLREAGPGELTFLADRRYAGHVAACKAAAMLVPRDWQGRFTGPVIRVDQPEAALEQVCEWFTPAPPAPAPGVHATAVVAPSARLGAGVSVGPHCVIDAEAEIGDRGVIHAGCFIGAGARIGPDCLIYPHVSIREFVQIGARAILHNGAVIGSDGWGYRVSEEQGHPVVRKIPHRGTVILGDDVEIGANVTIDRARFGATRLGHSVKIDNLVHLAHNVTVGDFTGMAAQVGISGSTQVGSGTLLLGQVGVAGHLRIGNKVVVGGRGAVTKDVPDGAYVSGDPARPHKETTSIRAHLWRLPELRLRIKELEQRIEELERGRAGGGAG